MGDTSHLNTGTSDSAVDMKIGILIVDECSDFVERHIVVLMDMLRSMGCSDGDIVVKQIPSISDTVMGVQFFAEYTDVDGVVIVMPQERLFALQALLGGIVHLQMQWNMPVAIGGADKAVDIVRMIMLQTDMEASAPDNQSERHVVN